MPDREDKDRGEEAEQPDINEDEEEALDNIWADIQSESEEEDE